MVPANGIGNFPVRLWFPVDGGGRGGDLWAVMFGGNGTLSGKTDAGCRWCWMPCRCLPSGSMSIRWNGDGDVREVRIRVESDCGDVGPGILYLEEPGVERRFEGYFRLSF